MRSRMTAVLVLAILAAVPASAAAAPVPAGAEWTQATFPSSDGVKLHADVLRPKNLPAGTKTPVILSIGPYFNHSGQTGPAGPVEGTSYDPVGPSEGPSDRFLDFVEGAKLMERGYTFVMVDLRGFGGSSGCLDWAGPGEQADVVNAVKWAASQSWSTGKVGMYGKSYDGVTGLIGANRQPAGLGAVVSQEPVYDLYRYLYGDGIRRLNSVLTPALYDLIDLTPGSGGRRPELQHRRAERHSAARLPGAEPGRPGWERRPLLGLLAPAQPDPRRQGVDRAAVPDPGPHREQHRGRRHGAVPRQPQRIRARLARPVGARPRQRARRERPPQDGPRGLLRRGHALLRPVPEGRPAPAVPGPTDRGADERRQVARRAVLAARGRHGLHEPLRTGSYTDDGSGSATGTSDTRGRVDDLTAPDERRASGRLGEGCRRRGNHAAQRQPGGRRL